MPRASELLHSVFGFPAFRPGQEEIVEAVLAGPQHAGHHADGRRQVAVLPAARAVPRRGDGRHLAADRADARSGPRAARGGGRGRGADLGQYRRGDRRGLPGAGRRPAEASLHGARTAGLGRHQPDCCAASSTTPDRGGRGALRQPVGPRLPPRLPAHRRAAPHAWACPLAAFTATADEETRAEIVTRLFDGEAPATFLRGFDRPNIHLAFAVKDTPARADPALCRRPQGPVRHRLLRPPAPRPRRWRRRSARPGTAPAPITAGWRPTSAAGSRSASSARTG